MSRDLAPGPACFTFDSPVYFDELDALGVMHNSRFAVHVERAQSALFEALGYGWASFDDRHPDLSYVVAALDLDFLAPVTAPGAMRVDVVALALGRTSATWGYRCSTPAAPGVEGGPVAVAVARRAVVHVPPGGSAPAPWSDAFRLLFARLQAGVVAT